MANANQSPRIIPLEEGWNDEIKAKVSQSVSAGLPRPAGGLAMATLVGSAVVVS